jgi:hypothetical protein
MLVENGKVCFGRFGPLRLAAADALDQPTAHTIGVSPEDDGTEVFVSIDTPVDGATGYRLMVRVGDTVLSAAFAGSTDPELVLILPAVAEETEVNYALRAEPLGKQYNGTLTLTPWIEPEDDTVITNVTRPTLVLGVDGTVVGASLSYVGGSWNGTITSTAVALYKTDDEKVTSEEITDYTWGTVPDVPGYKLFVRETKDGPLGAVSADSLLSAVVTSATVTIVPRQPINEDWFLEAKRAPTPSSTTWTGIVCLRTGASAPTLRTTVGSTTYLPVEVEYFGIDPQNYTDLEPHWRPTTSLGVDSGGIARWQWASDPDFPGEQIRTAGTVMSRVRFRYRLVASGTWSTYPVDAKIASEALITPPVTAGWHVMPFRTAEEYALNLKGGDQGQMWHGLNRSASDPTLIIGGQDMAGIWISDDDGITWRKSLDEGLRAFGMQGVLVDPTDPNRWYAVGEELYTSVESNAPSGIYLSVDKGKHWTLIHSEPEAHHQRTHSEIVYDPNTSGSTLTLYTTITRWNGSAVVMRSTDRGATWTTRSTIPATTATPGNVRGRVNSLFHHPSTASVLFLCTQGGLFKSTNGGTSWTRLSGSGSLPVGDVQQVAINPANGNEIYAVVGVATLNTTSGTAVSQGLWRTTNGGTSWTQITVPATRASKIFVGFATGGGWQPTASRDLYLISRGQPMRVSHNNGSSWLTATVIPQPGRTDGWDKSIFDSVHNNNRPEMTTKVMPHPLIAGRAFIHSCSHNFRTDDAGNNCRYSGEGFNGEMPFTGHSSIAFSDDPLRFTVVVTDSGYRMTENGGLSWHVGRVKGYTEAHDPLKNSCHSVAIHPTNDSLTVMSSGFKAPGSETRIFLSDENFPDSYIGVPDIPDDPSTPNVNEFVARQGTAAANSPWVRVRNTNKQTYFLHWNRDTPTVVYEDSVRSTTSGETWTNYASGFGGCRAVYPGDNDICYGLTKLAGPERYELRRSNDRGATIASTVAIPYPGILFTNLYYAIIAIHPTDPAIFFCRGSGGDLARYDGNTATWRTGYGMPARHLAAHSSVAGGVKSIAIDPQDANVGYVTMESPGNHSIWRSLNIQAAPASVAWEDITKDFHRSTVFPKLWVHPLTGDVMAGSDGVGGIRMLPPPGTRSHATLTQYFQVWN